MKNNCKVSTSEILTRKRKTFEVEKKYPETILENEEPIEISDIAKNKN